MLLWAEHNWRVFVRLVKMLEIGPDDDKYGPPNKKRPWRGYTDDGDDFAVERERWYAHIELSDVDCYDTPHGNKHTVLVSVETPPKYYPMGTYPPALLEEPWLDLLADDEYEDEEEREEWPEVPPRRSPSPELELPPWFGSYFDYLRVSMCMP